MQYPKPVMRKNELIEMGFSKTFLDAAILNQTRGLTSLYIAWKDDPTKKNSPYNFDTAALEKYRKSSCF